MKTNVCIIGHFGANKAFRDGQTVKTRILEQAFRSYASEKLNIFKVDTYYYKHYIFRFLYQLTAGICSCNRIVLCVSKGGRRIFFPLMYLLAKVFGKKIFHCAIGGRLAEEVRESDKWKRYVNSFQNNWVESIVLAEELKSLGVSHAEYMTNFKILPDITVEDLPAKANQPMAFCTFSRVAEEKGITDAVHAVIAVNEGALQPRVRLDIYGPIQKGYEATFQKLMELAPESIRYCGEVEPDQSVEILKQYDMMLFPTYWRGEGIPGSVIDALCAGLPIIARKWRYCDEMLSHGITGLCYDFDHPELLSDWIAFAVSNPEEIAAMRKNCLAAAEKFRARSVVPRMVEQLLEG